MSFNIEQNGHTVTPVVWRRGKYLIEIDGKLHVSHRRRTLRRMAQRMTGITPPLMRQLAGSRA